MKFSFLKSQISFTQSGQSLFEVIVALGITALVLIGAASLSTTSVRNSTFSKNDSVATKFAQEGSEFLREQRDGGWDSFKTNYTDKSCLGASYSTSDCAIDNAYSRSISFTCFFIDPLSPTPAVKACADTTVNMIYAKLIVSWSDGQGTHEVRNITTLTRWR